MTGSTTVPPGTHGSVAEEIAALAEALRARGGDGSAHGSTPGETPGADSHDEHDHWVGIDTCEICPLCRVIAALHTVSPAAVTALADLVHQAEVTLRALATDLQAREGTGAAAPREDIPVDDLPDD